MMPAIQDFERRLGILHQVEPILENAINTLSKVVDLGAPLPAVPAAAPVPVAPKPAKPAAKTQDLAQLKALLAQAEAKKKEEDAALEAETAAAAGSEDDALSGLLGSKGGLAGLLGSLGGGQAAEIAADSAVGSSDNSGDY